jgi:hypothetical protein
MAAKKLGPIELFYIDHNLNLADDVLAKAVGCTPRQVKFRRSKILGKNREGGVKGEPETQVFNQAKPEREAELVNQAQKNLAAQETATPAPPVNTRPAPGMRIDALLAKKGGTVSLTQAAAEMADMFDGIAPDSKGPVLPTYDPFSDETRVHKIK